MTAVLYGPSLAYGYVYEDVARAAFTWEGWGAWLASLRHTPTRSVTRGLWAWLGHHTDYAPSWQHAASIALHLLNGILLWCLAHRLRLGLGGATMATGLFLLHPVQTEAVGYISGRADVLLTCSVLVALCCAERGWWALAWLAAASAAGAKEAGVLGLALVPLWAGWRGLPSWTPRVRVGWAVACVPVVLLVLVWFQRAPLLWMPWDGALVTLAAWTRLLALWVVPWGQTLDHDWAALPAWAGPVAGLGWAGALLWASRHQRSLWSFALPAAGLIVVPRLVWQLGEGLHEHHLSLATVALSLATGSLFTRKDATC